MFDLKKTASIFLSFLIVFSFLGCAVQKNEPVSFETAQSSTTQSTASASSPVEESQTVTVTAKETTAKETTTPKETTAETAFEKPTEAQTEKTGEKKAQAESTTTEKTTAVSQQSTEQSTITCFVTIDCTNVQKNLSSLKKGKQSFVPKNGYILKTAKVTLPEDATAFDALKKACKENVCTDNCKYCQKSGIQLEFSFTPAYQSYYVEGIHQLYEKDCGSLSGWMFNVNGTYPDVSSSVYKVNDQDTITFAYTASMGDDLTE